MLAFIALFIIPMPIMFIRHKINNLTLDSSIKLLGEYCLTIVENAFLTFFVTRYIIIRSPIDIGSFSSVQFFLKYCVLALVIGLVSVFVEKLLMSKKSKDLAVTMMGNGKNFIQKTPSGIEDVINTKKSNLAAKNSIISNLLFGKNSYCFWLFAVTIVGFALIYSRSRYGVDLTDDAWYTADPVFVAKGSTPYVNLWNQSAGFSIPLYVLYKGFLVLNGGTEGIFLFTRMLYCIWKPLVVALTFILLKKGGIKIHPILALPLICFNAAILPAINYNSIGFSYMFLIVAIMCVALKADKSNKKRFVVALIAGILMGRCVIATPATILGCIAILIYLIIRKGWPVLKGYIIGGVISAVFVVGYCCIRGGIRNFIIGIQYFIRDQSYYDGMKEKIVPFWESTLYLWHYIMPAIIVFVVLIVARILLKGRDIILNKLLLLIIVVLIVVSVYNLTKYDGSTYSIAYSTKYTWFIPLASLFLLCKYEERDKLRIMSCISIIYMCIFLFQGYLTYYGFSSRSTWNFPSLILCVYCAYLCYNEIYSGKNTWIPKAIVIILGIVITFFVVKGSYSYVYRDMPVEQLTEEVDEGLWKGCYTTPVRAKEVVRLEHELQSITNEEDDILCWGNWSCFMNLMHNGNYCVPSSLGAGNKNGFDYWHFMQKVPNKVFVNISEMPDVRTDKYKVWPFINQFYHQTNEIDYLSYDDKGDELKCIIYEYEINDSESALQYADEHATRVFEP